MYLMVLWLKNFFCPSLINPFPFRPKNNTNWPPSEARRLPLVCEILIGGVYWTKFECISDKIRRILTNDTCASAALDKLARGKTQKLPIIFICGSPHTPRREAETFKGRKFLVLLPPLQYQHTCNISHYCHRTQYLAIIHL